MSLQFDQSGAFLTFCRPDYLLLMIIFLSLNLFWIRRGGTGGAIAPPSFWDLFSKFWEFFENPLFAIYCSPPIKNLLPPTLLLSNLLKFVFTNPLSATIHLNMILFEENSCQSSELIVLLQSFYDPSSYI